MTESGLDAGFGDDRLDLSGDLLKRFCTGPDGESLLIMRHGEWRMKNEELGIENWELGI